VASYNLDRRNAGQPVASTFVCLALKPPLRMSDTMPDYATVNGVSARGGSLDGPGPGPLIAGGILYVNGLHQLWGYTNYGTAPDNVLLAFCVDGQQAGSFRAARLEFTRKLRYAP